MCFKSLNWRYIVKQQPQEMDIVARVSGQEKLVLA